MPGYGAPTGMGQKPTGFSFFFPFLFLSYFAAANTSSGGESQMLQKEDAGYWYFLKETDIKSLTSICF